MHHLFLNAFYTNCAAVEQQMNEETERRETRSEFPRQAVRPLPPCREPMGRRGEIRFTGVDVCAISESVKRRSSSEAGEERETHWAMIEYRILNGVSTSSCREGTLRAMVTKNKESSPDFGRSVTAGSLEQPAVVLAVTFLQPPLA